MKVPVKGHEDGLNLLRVDERCDTDKDGIIEAGETTWRVVEVNTHMAGALGEVLGKRVYQYANAADSTPDNSDDFTYTYDIMDNVVAIYSAEVTGRGNELYYFTQDAFGNELTTSPFNGSSWSTARTTDGVTEHQTGKWIDPFTGLYHFYVRWYDSGLGRFVGRDTEKSVGGDSYAISHNSPTRWPDWTGMEPVAKLPNGTYCDLQYSRCPAPDRELNPCNCSCKKLKENLRTNELGLAYAQDCIKSGDPKSVPCQHLLTFAKLKTALII